MDNGEHIIPKNPGARPDPVDFRDFDYERLQEVILGAPPVDWDKGYIVPEVEGIKVEDQNGSLSCVGQGWSKYAEVLEKVENKNFTDLSAKYIYSQIFIPPTGGSYVRDGAKLVVNQGVGLEAQLPSYPATEADMRRVEDITDPIREAAKTYKAKSYASIWHKNNIDTFAQAIQQNLGVITGVYGHNSGWGMAYVKPPTEGGAWGHAFYCVGFVMVEGKKYIKFLNSWGTNWGESGYGYLGEDYFTTSNVFSAWTLVDLPNPINDMDILRLVKVVGGKDIYTIGRDGAKHLILNRHTFEKGRDVFGIWGDWDKVEELLPADFDAIPDGETILSVPNE